MSGPARQPSQRSPAAWARLAVRVARARLSVPGPRTVEEIDEMNAARLRRDVAPGALAAERGSVTKLLFERLTAADVAAVEALIRDTPGAWEHYFGAAERAGNPGLVLALGMWLGADVVAERTGLLRGEPPEDVHAMARGPLAAAGGLYEADMVVDALASAAVEMGSVRAALDFGCSSGRVLRPLSAAYPQVDWWGCDPNGPAVAWARENLGAVSFFVSGDVPPLKLADASLDLVYGISIWSHFEPQRGMQWFEEMRRVLRPGGHLVMTTHGLNSIAYYLEEGLRSLAQSTEIEHDLYRRGWWYAAEFGAKGDWGVSDPAWGTTFLSPEWVLSKLCPRWRVLEFAPGRNQDNQDVYVLQRV